MITKFNIESQFYYDINEIDIYFAKIKDKNCIKVNDKELESINEKIDEIQLFKDSKNSTKFITIKKDIFNCIQNYIKRVEIKDPLTEFIKSKFTNEEIRSSLSCRKLVTMYEQETGKKTNRTTVNKIIKNTLGFRYLKTTTKCPKINLVENKNISFAFIKIVARAIMLGFNIIFLDESNITNKNSNYRCFRKYDETIYFKYSRLFKSNLLLAVDEKNVLYYEITDDTTSEAIFLSFAKNLINKLKDNYNKKYILVLDNLSSHKTSLIKQFFIDNKINIVFNSPYHSEWNSVEYAFRALKRKTYQILFKSKEEQINYIKTFLDSEEFSNTLQFNFCETLRQYMKFINDNKYVNLNE